MLVNAAFVAAGALAAGLHRAGGERHRRPAAPDRADASTARSQALTTAAVRAPRAARVPRSGSPIRLDAMNGFDSYRVRERADIARWILVVAFLVLSGAFFRTQVIQHDKFQLKAETNRLRPIPLTPPRGVDPRPAAAGSSPRTCPATRSSCSPRRPTRSGRCWPGCGRFVPVDTRRGRPRSSGASRQARYQPALVFGDATFETVARLEEHRSVLPGLVIQAEPKRLYPAGKAVGAPGRLRLRGDRAGPHANRYPGRRARLDRRARRASSGSTTTRCGASKGVRYIEVNARGRLVREEAGSGLAAARRPGKPISTTIDLDLQRFIDSIWPAGVRGAMVAMTPKGEVRALYSAPTYDPNAVRRRHLAARTGARSTTTRPGRCSTGRSRRAIRPPRRSSWPSPPWR